jgi:hypothetical protein
MTRFSNLIRAVLTRPSNRPEYLDISRLNERMRADIGLVPMPQAEQRGALRQSSNFQSAVVVCNGLSISQVSRRFV